MALQNSKRNRQWTKRGNSNPTKLEVNTTTTFVYLRKTQVNKIYSSHKQAYFSGTGFS